MNLLLNFIKKFSDQEIKDKEVIIKNKDSNEFSKWNKFNTPHIDSIKSDQNNDITRWSAETALSQVLTKNLKDFLFPAFSPNEWNFNHSNHE